ncbi:hypothetical protein MBLNU13_g11330t1 [Cladosporium sp. NU13]
MRKRLMEIMFAADEQEVPAVLWTDLFDDPSNDSDGWSFVDNSRTPWPVDGRRWLFERIQKRPECRQRFVSDQTANRINEAKLRDWMKTIDDFRGRFRNLFIEDGIVVFVTQYHKGEQYKADVKIIYRYLPREVGDIKDEVRRGIKRKGDPFEAHSKRSRIEREHRVRHMNIIEEMSWIIGEDVSLRSAQGEALSAIKNGEGKIVVVMPIGAGKSMLFMLPAVVGRGGVTVVVVPFVTLRHDMKGRGERMGVSVGEWDSKRSMDGKLVVFVTPEAAIREGF